MMKEHERREYLKTLDEEKRKKEESKFEEMKKKHGDHPKVHHPVRPQPFLHDWVGAFLSREKKLNTQEHILFVLITCLLLLMTWEQRVGTLLRALQTPLYKLPFFLYRCVICCQNSYKDTEIHKEEARTRCKTVGMPA